MKTTIKIEKEIEIKYVNIVLPVLYGDEDIPRDFPLRTGDEWTATVDIDTGRIIGWPAGKTGDLYMKVCDGGTYRLMDESLNVIASIIEDYVPNGVVPGEYGDYVDLKINEQGVITNWPKRPDVRRFFNQGEEE